jgi:hypothetical protein
MARFLYPLLYFRGNPNLYEVDISVTGLEPLTFFFLELHQIVKMLIFAHYQPKERVRLLM